MVSISDAEEVHPFELLGVRQVISQDSVQQRFRQMSLPDLSAQVDKWDDFFSSSWTARIAYRFNGGYVPSKREYQTAIITLQEREAEQKIPK